jgi:hypothetical protein
MNYNPPFHDASSLPHSPAIPQPSMAQSMYPSATIRSHVATSSINPSLGSDDEQVAEPKLKKSKPKPTKASGKTQKGETASSLKAKPGGCPVGSRNFQPPETQMLLGIVEDHLPIGGDSWQAVASCYNSWAQPNGFKEQDKKSLKQKFDAVRHYSCSWCNLCLLP